jgi:hypothetical protein
VAAWRCDANKKRGTLKPRAWQSQFDNDYAFAIRIVLKDQSGHVPSRAALEAGLKVFGYSRGFISFSVIFSTRSGRSNSAKVSMSPSGLGSW